MINDTVCGTIFSDTAQIILSDPPEANFSATTECEGNATVFTDNSNFPGGPVFSWSWDFDDNGATSILANPTHTFSGSGTYNVKLVVSTADGCLDSIIIPVTVNPLPTANYSHSGVCFGHPTSFTDLSTISGASITNFYWDFDDNGATSTQQNPTHTFSGVGSYSVQLIVETNHGCRDTLVQTVDILPSPVPAFTWSQVCHGDPTVFTDGSTATGGSVTSWVWDFGDGNTSTQQNPSNTYQNPGTYNVQLVTTSNAGCVDSITIPVTVDPLPVPEFENNIACFNDITSFNDLSTIVSGTIASWDWDFGDGTPNSGDQNPDHIYTAAGTYMVTLTVTSSEGCVGSVTQEVEVIPLPYTPQINNDYVCEGFPAVLTITGVPADIWIEWFYNDSTSSPFMTGNLFNTTPVFGKKVYWVEAVNSQGCRSRRLPIFAQAYPKPGKMIMASHRQAEIPNAIVEFWIENGYPVDIVAYSWDFGDGGTSNQAAPVHEYTQAGVYTVTVTIIDENGCEHTVTQEEYIEVTQNIYVWPANAFTPNGDGLNDFWYIEHQLITDLHVMIFDRWGRMVFESYDPNFRWDGNGVDGGELPEGVYMYSLDLTAYDGTKQKQSGSITLLR